MLLSKAVYAATTTGLTVTLFTKKPLSLNPPLLLTVKAANLLDALGRQLDGNGSGQPVANFVATFRKKGVTVNSARTAASSSLSAAAVDVVLNGGTVFSHRASH